jgi:hypothetical protein
MGDVKTGLQTPKTPKRFAVEDLGDMCPLVYPSLSAKG